MKILKNIFLGIVIIGYIIIMICVFLYCALEMFIKGKAERTIEI